jgi:signal transduction histidine kinase
MKISGFKFSLTSQLIIGVTVILAIALAILERKASTILMSDKTRSLKDQSSQISYSLAVSVSEKVKRLDRHLRLILTHDALKTPLELRPRGEDMVYVGTIKRAFGSEWETSWIIKPVDDKNAEKFSLDFATNLQKVIAVDKVRSDEHMFGRMIAADGQPLFVMLIRLSKPTDTIERIAVGLLSPSAFFDIVAPFKGSLTSAFLVDPTGLVYAHPSLSLTGAILRGNPIVDRISRKFSASEQDQFQDGDETLIGSFDSIPRTNLVAVTTISLTQAAAPLRELKWSFVVLGLGLLLLAAILATYISYLLKSPISRIRRVVDDIASGKRAYVDSKSSEFEISELEGSLNELDKKLRIKEVENENVTHEKIYKEKMTAFTRLSSGLVNELRNPLVGILGHTQLAREKIRDPESIRRHLDMIERDVRKTKELIEDISQFSGVERQDLGAVNVYEALTAAIEQAGRIVHPQNISIIKNLESVASVTANAVLLRKALVNLITSCGQLISSDGNREIIIRLESEEDFAKITMIFQSQVISEEDRKRIFDPFLVTHGENDVQIELGLDLALARGIFEAHDAQIELEQNGETHFQFTVRLPKVVELPATETPRKDMFESIVAIPEDSPFIEDPGLELKGLNFALPDFSVTEPTATATTTATATAAVIESESRSESVIASAGAAAAAAAETGLMGRQIMANVPVESLKIKMRKPTLRI